MHGSFWCALLPVRVIYRIPILEEDVVPNEPDMVPAPELFVL